MTFLTLAQYGMQVVHILREQGNDAVLLLSKEWQLNMIRKYSAYFDVDFNEPDGGHIRLKKDITKKDLLLYFRGAMPLFCIDAFTRSEALDVLKSTK